MLDVGRWMLDVGQGSVMFCEIRNKKSEIRNKLEIRSMKLNF